MKFFSFYQSGGYSILFDADMTVLITNISFNTWNRFTVNFTTAFSLISSFFFYLLNCLNHLTFSKLKLSVLLAEKEGIRKAYVEWASMKENVIHWITKAVKQRLSKRNAEASEEESVDNATDQNGNENAAGIFCTMLIT